jgi:hypothetical protein
LSCVERTGSSSRPLELEYGELVFEFAASSWNTTRRVLLECRREGGNWFRSNSEFTVLNSESLNRSIFLIKVLRIHRWSWRWPHGGRQLLVFKPLDLHGRYPQQGRRWGSSWSGTRRYAWGHGTQDLYRFG